MLEKTAFVAKMLGSDGGYGDAGTPPTSKPRRHARAPEPRLHARAPEMLFTGDLLCPGRLDARSLSAALRARIARAACLVVNLEATVDTRRHAIDPVLSLRGLRQLLAYERDPEDAGWVSRIDVDDLRALLSGLDVQRVVATVANNHTLDDGLAGFDRSLALLRGLGVEVAGDARDDDGAVLVDLGRARVGLVAIAYGTNRWSDVGPIHLRFDAVPYRLSRRRMTAIARRLRARGATHLVALLHWGHEHEHEPAPEQRACARVLFDAGFSAVIGHHPHILQRSEAEDGCWTSYSLGDFVGGDRTIWSRFGAMASLRFQPDGAVVGEVIPTVQAPFWDAQRTMLLEEAPAFERSIFGRFFAARTTATSDGSRRPSAVGRAEAA